MRPSATSAARKAAFGSGCSASRAAWSRAINQRDRSGPSGRAAAFAMSPTAMASKELVSTTAGAYVGARCANTVAPIRSGAPSSDTASSPRKRRVTQAASRATAAQAQAREASATAAGSTRSGGAMSSHAAGSATLNATTHNAKAARERSPMPSSSRRSQRKRSVAATMTNRVPIPALVVA
jgi:hypothetical protein